MNIFLRDETIVSIEESVLQNLENYMNLAVNAANVALSNINWSPNDPFALL
jgi:uncharacterized alkaline shock family protein YloU